MRRRPGGAGPQGRACGQAQGRGMAGEGEERAGQVATVAARGRTRRKKEKRWEIRWSLDCVLE